jgi:hypothetical protein
MAARKFYILDHKKDGVGGVVTTKPTTRKQDRRASPEFMYAVIFFPKISGIGKASVNFFAIRDTLSATPAAARVRFLDRLAKGCTWAQYARAGHKVRRVKITDVGDGK